MAFPVLLDGDIEAHCCLRLLSGEKAIACSLTYSDCRGRWSRCARYLSIMYDATYKIYSICCYLPISDNPHSWCCVGIWRRCWFNFLTPCLACLPFAFLPAWRGRRGRRHFGQPLAPCQPYTTRTASAGSCCADGDGSFGGDGGDLSITRKRR